MITFMLAMWTVGNLAVTITWIKMQRKQENAELTIDDWADRPILGPTEWKRLHTYLETVRHDASFDDIVREVINNGFRFTCSQIYELWDVHNTFEISKEKPKSSWPHVQKLTNYDFTRQIEASEKVFEALYGDALTSDKALLPGLT
jgi:hypothetical protein